MKTEKESVMEIHQDLLPLLDKSDVKKILQGCGTGIREKYLPFIETYQNHGQGRRTVLPSTKFAREYQTLSSIERDFLLLADWCSSVQDIREQFPLDINITAAIAKELGFKHPNVRGVLRIMTTDARLTMDDGTERIRTIKPKEALCNTRVLEKFQIERTYWERQGVSDWGIVTPGEIDPVCVANIKQLRVSLDPARQGVSNPEISRARTYLESNLERHPCLASAAEACDEALALEPGQSLTIAKYLIATHVWSFDLRIPFHPKTPGQHRQFGFGNSETKKNS